MLDFLGNLERTHTCGELRAEDAGKSVVLLGWVNRRRDHGNLIFLDLRDRYGISQVVLDKDLSPAGHAKAEQTRPEYVVAAIGKVRLRGKDVINPKMATGEIEIVADEVRILNDSKVPPFSPAEDAIGNEEVRLKYRYLDLRRAEIQHNFEVRHKIALAVRRFEATLSSSPWLVGSAYSLADIDAFSICNSLPTLVPDLVSDVTAPRLMEWLSRIRMRPAVRAALAMSRTGKPELAFAPGPEHSRWG